MGNRAAKFVSTLVAGIIAGAPLSALSQTAPTATSTAIAADECLASPKGVAPQGQHWYYRLDRTTKRQCWYLRAAGDKNGTKTAQAATDMPAAETSPPQQQHAVQDARAEYPAPRGGAAAKAPSAIAQAAAAPTPQPAADRAAEGNTPQPASPQSSSPWPDVPTASAPPAPQPAAEAIAAQPTTKPLKSPSPVALAAADSNPTDKPGGSVQMLLLVIGGALTLAGILASLVYRFAGARVRVQGNDRQGYWDDWETQHEDASRAPWRDAEPSGMPPRPIDFDAAPPQPARHPTKLAAISREIHLIDARKSRAPNAAAQPETTMRDEGEARMFEGAFEIVAATPELAANESAKNQAIEDQAIEDRAIKGRADDGHRTDAPAHREADAVDVDVITTMLEQLAMEGPRLSRLKPEAEPANSERSRRGRSAARA